MAPPSARLPENQWALPERRHRRPSSLSNDNRHLHDANDDGKVNENGNKAPKRQRNEHTNTHGDGGSYNHANGHGNGQAKRNTSASSATSSSSTTREGRFFDVDDEFPLEGAAEVIGADNMLFGVSAGFIPQSGVLRHVKLPNPDASFHLDSYVANTTALDKDEVRVFIRMVENTIRQPDPVAGYAEPRVPLEPDTMRNCQLLFSAVQLATELDFTAARRYTMVQYCRLVSQRPMSIVVNLFCLAAFLNERVLAAECVKRLVNCPHNANIGSWPVDLSTSLPATYIVALLKALGAPRQIAHDTDGTVDDAAATTFLAFLADRDGVC